MMALRTFTAREFIEPTLRGGNLPMIIRGECGDEERSICLKTRAGYGARAGAPGIELMSSLLARHLELLTPEPVLVEVPARFHEQVFEHPRHRGLLEASAGLNFGTIAMGPDWKTWPVDMSVRSIAEETIEAILVFDALVQQTDREADNPNLLWRGHEIAVIDHEKCFGYLSLATDAARPWREFFAHRPMQTHCLRAAGRELVRDDFGKSMWEKLIALEMEGTVSDARHLVLGAFPEAQVEIGRISAYLDAVFRNVGDFLDYLKHSLSQ